MMGDAALAFLAGNLFGLLVLVVSEWLRAGRDDGSETTKVTIYANADGLYEQADVAKATEELKARGGGLIVYGGKPATTGITVRQLADRLAELPDEMPVVAIYDCGCAGGYITDVELGKGVDDDRESVLLIVDGEAA